MSHSNFYRLNSGESTVALAEWVHEEMDMETVRCSLYENHQRAGKRLTDLSVLLAGSSNTDIGWTWQSECLINDRTLELFEHNKYTGFEVKKVKSCFRDSERCPERLWELSVTGWGGVASTESGIRLIDHCDSCGQNIYSAWTRADKICDSSRWDGSDFFMVWPLPKYIFVTKRVVDSIQKAALSGAVMQPANDLLFPTSVIPRLGPGRLSYYMPEKRAHELGKPLGIY